MNCVDRNDPGALVQIQDLRVDWITPGSIQWGWQAAGTDLDLDHYELVVGPSSEAVCQRGEGVSVWTPEDNPELAELTFRGAGQVEPVDHTITDGLAPATAHFASLIAIDTRGRRSVSRIAGDTTQEASTHEFRVFDDRLENGWYMMAFRSVSDGAGGAHLEFQQTCSEGLSECWTNANLLNDAPQPIRASANPAFVLLPGGFATTAFAEFAISTSTGVRARYGEVKLGFGTTCDLFYLAPFATRADGEYRRVQVPLRVLRHSWTCDGSTPTGELLTADAVALGLTAVGVGAPWDNGSVVRLDDVAIRW